MNISIFSMLTLFGVMQVQIFFLLTFLLFKDKPIHCFLFGNASLCAAIRVGETSVFFQLLIIRKKELVGFFFFKRFTAQEKKKFTFKLDYGIVFFLTSKVNYGFTAIFRLAFPKGGYQSEISLLVLFNLFVLHPTGDPSCVCV